MSSQAGVQPSTAQNRVTENANAAKPASIPQNANFNFTESSRSQAITGIARQNSNSLRQNSFSFIFVIVIVVIFFSVVVGLVDGLKGNNRGTSLGRENASNGNRFNAQRLQQAIDDFDDQIQQLIFQQEGFQQQLQMQQVQNDINQQMQIQQQIEDLQNIAFDLSEECTV